MGTKIGVLATYPSTPCGIATFTEALVKHLGELKVDVGVIRMVDRPEVMQAPVVGQWLIHDLHDASSVAAQLNTFDVAVIQHEYGIFGGLDGQYILAVLDLLTVPVITVLHTVLSAPTPNQYRVLEHLCARSSALVTMTITAQERLVDQWHINPARIHVISHGAVDNRMSVANPSRITLQSSNGIHLAPQFLTWGLLGEGKGIEWALQAMAALKDLKPAPTYSIVGQTHPRVLERNGEHYRSKLEVLVDQLGLSEQVNFNATYLSGPDLRLIVRKADVIVLPYDSVDQVTSGVLTEAVAAGKPVISTAFPHAVELLSSGAGLLVPQGDPDALAAAMRRMITEPGLAAATTQRSHELATSLLWPAVAQQYIDLTHTVIAHSFVSVA